MKEQLEKIKEQSKQEISGLQDLDELQQWEVKVFGKKGELTSILRQVGQLPPTERPVLGQLVNLVKQELTELVESQKARLKERQNLLALEREKVDVSLPGASVTMGRLHPLTVVSRRIKEIFLGMGFSSVEGPEVESEYYNFESLNIPPDHPSRDMWDSFYFNSSLLLRSHTSPVQVRIMEHTPPPLRIISMGRCYRRDAVDATHSWMFHQVEGFMVDEVVTFADLKGVLATFAREMFGKERRVKFTPDYFPFTEPSAGLAIDCALCKGQGCRSCGQSGWLEILGSGMIHPRVLEYADKLRQDKAYDPQKVSGFAFGMGIERIAMLLYGITDMRLFFENDMRFLEQF